MGASSEHIEPAPLAVPVEPHGQGVTRFVCEPPIESLSSRRGSLNLAPVANGGTLLLSPHAAGCDARPGDVRLTGHDATDMPAFNVFTRRDGTIRHFWGDVDSGCPITART